MLKRNFWNNNVELLRDDHVIGKIEKSGFWGIHTKGYLFDKKYTFLSKGNFSTRTEIWDDKNNFVGEVTYSIWSSKAKIDLNGKKYYWGPKNLWGTKWKLTDELGREIFLEKNEFIVNFASTKNLEFNYFLSAFLLYNSYKRMAAAAAA